MTVIIELNLIADIGLVGLPNAGKSTLLDVMTNAHPRIGAYPFTTKIPNLGVLSRYDREIVLADVPGLIEGASNGAGLGDKFLKHISRTKAVAVLVDLSSENPIHDYGIVLQELERYERSMITKPRITIGTKLDLVQDDSICEIIKNKLQGETYFISCHARTGIDEITKAFFGLSTKS